MTDNGEEDTSSDTTLVEEDIDEIPETRDVGAPGVAENTEPIEEELPAPVTTRYGRTIKMPKRFGDYICNEVKSDLTQELDESEGAQHTPELDMADHGESSPLAATLGYLRRDVQLLVQEQEKNKVDLWMDMEARWKELLEQDITKGLNMEVSEEELLGAPTACKIAASPVTVKEAEVFCKINTDDKKYLNIRSEECKEIIPPVCKTTGVYSDNSLACKTAEATQPSICKRMDIVTQQFGEEEDPR